MFNNATKWTIFVGLNDGKTGKPIKQERVEQAFSRLVDGITADFGGCTLVAATGAWGNTREDSVKIEIVTLKPNGEAWDSVHGAAVFIKNALRQQEVYVTKESIEFTAI